MNLKSVLFYVFLISTAAMQAQQVHWLRESIGTAHNGTDVLFVDSIGNSYVTGNYRYNGFNVAVYDSLGSETILASSDAVPECLDVTPTSISVSSHGNIYVVGYFRGSLKIQGKTIISKGYADSFISKFSRDGSIKWLKRYGGSSSGDFTYRVETDAFENCFIGAVVELPISYDNTPLSSAPGPRNTLLAKINPDGDLIWYRLGYSTFYPNIKASKHGELYFQGEFQHWVKWGNDSVPTLGSADQYIGKYGTNGDLKFLSIIASTYYTNDYSFALSNSGETYLLANFFQQAVVNDSLIIDQQQIGRSIFAFDDYGELLWIKGIQIDTASFWSSHLVLDSDQSLNLFGQLTEHIDSSNYFNYESFGLLNYRFNPLIGSIIDTFFFDNYTNGLVIEMDANNSIYQYGDLSSIVVMGGDTLNSTRPYPTSYLARFSEKKAKSVVIDSTIRLFPNPFSQTVNFSGMTGETTFTVYSLLGQEMVKGFLKESTTSVDLSALPQGCYLIEVNGRVIKMIKI
jgi:hypothetical protein